MEIRQLKYLLDVVQKGTVRAAAEANFVTQPAVSLQLQRLEDELGEPLFARRGRRLVPTEMGEMVARHAADVLRSLEGLEKAVAGVRGLETGSLRMGGIDAASIYVLPDLYQEFHARYPGVSIEITVGDTRELLRALRSGGVELATTTLPVDDAALHSAEIYREELIAVARPGHELSSRRRVTLRELTEAGLITYPAGATTRRLIDQTFAAHGEVMRPRMEISSPEAMRHLAAAGLGVCILPQPVVTDGIERGTLARLRTGEARFERSIGMVHRGRETLSPAARVFLEMVEQRFSPKEGKRSR